MILAFSQVLLHQHVNARPGWNRKLWVEPLSGHCTQCMHRQRKKGQQISDPPTADFFGMMSTAALSNVTDYVGHGVVGRDTKHQHKINENNSKEPPPPPPHTPSTHTGDYFKVQCKGKARVVRVQHD